MAEARWLRVARLLEEAPQDLSGGAKICWAARSLLDGHDASLGVVLAGFYSGFAAVGTVAVLIDEAQFQLGDGPVFDLKRSSVPIVVDDTTSHTFVRDYPALATVLSAHKVRSLAAFPLRAGVENVGSLTVYREQPGALTADQYALGLVAASFALAEVVNSRAGVTGQGPGHDLPPQQLGSPNLQVAAGMVAEALGCSVVESLVRIRSHAFAAGQPVSVIAHLITHRQLMLKP